MFRLDRELANEFDGNPISGVEFEREEWDDACLLMYAQSDGNSSYQHFVEFDGKNMDYFGVSNYSDEMLQEIVRLWVEDGMSLGKIARMGVKRV